MTAGGGRTVRRSEAGGVPVFFAEHDGECHAALVFRVGRADETLVTCGATHLVEHLALYGVGRRRHDVNGYVDLTTTAFTATGTEEEVTTFLRDVAAALHDLPVERLDVEKQILRTESAARGRGFTAHLLWLRFGAAGYGLVDYKESGLRRLDGDDLRRWCAERFTAGNAAVWYAGPRLPDLDLPLPSGRRFAPPVPRLVPQPDGPLWEPNGEKVVALSFLAPDTFAARVGLSVAVERAYDRLRLGEGILYDIDSWFDALDGEVAHAVLSADCLPEHAPAVRDGLLAIVEELAEEGPTDAELRERADDAFRRPDDLDERTARLDRAVMDELLARRERRGDTALALAGLQPAAVADAWRAALDSALLLAPRSLGVPGERFSRCGIVPQEAVEGRRFEPQIEGALPVVIGDEGLSVLFDDGPMTIRFADVVGLYRGHALLDVQSWDGTSITLPAGDHVDGAELLRLVEDAIPADLVIDVADVEDPEDAVERLADGPRWRPSFLKLVHEELPDEIDDGEQLVNVAEATRGLHAGLLALTDRRVLFLGRGLGRRELLEVPLDEVAEVDGHAGLLGARLRLDTVDGAVRFHAVSPRERAAEMAEELDVLAEERQADRAGTNGSGSRGDAA